MLNVSIGERNVMLLGINNMQLLDDISLLILVLSHLNTTAIQYLHDLSRYEVKLAKSLAFISSFISHFPFKRPTAGKLVMRRLDASSVFEHELCNL